MSGAVRSKIRSHTLIFSDFETKWYRKWAKLLKQDPEHLAGHKLRANKFWQNAVMCQALDERGKLKPGSAGLGFGVGQERLPAVFAKLGVNVMATDQDFHGHSAKLWAEQELATGLGSLNQLGIASQDDISKHIQFQAVDMTKIPASLKGKYDFIWSNCALGHLGSITAGLEFIKSSLVCLKPGGVAVHTTELNAMSDQGTVTLGNTVIFRLHDIYHLMYNLTEKGYICSPLQYHLGRSKDDFRVSMQPEFGNDFSKIQVGGHIATQAVLVIRRPKTKAVATLGKRIRLSRLSRAYKKGLAEMHRHSQLNPEFRLLLESQQAGHDTVHIAPKQQKQSFKVNRGKVTEVFIDYVNNSPVSLYSLYGHLRNTPPTVLATDKPQNHNSKFADKQWAAESKNRPSSDFYIKQKSGYKHVDRVLPGQEFAFRVPLNAGKLKKGKYQENFSIVQEGRYWVGGSGINVTVEVV